jgi:hypothetical protein
MLRAMSDYRPILGADGRPWRESERARLNGMSWRDEYGAQALPHVLTFSGIVQSGWNTFFGEFDEARRKSYEDANVMRRDCFLMSLLEERKEDVSSLNWHLEPEDASDQRQLDVRDHLDATIRGVYGYRRIVWELLDALWYGRMAEQFKWYWIGRAWKGQTPGPEGQTAGMPVKTLSVRQFDVVNGDKIRYQRDGTPYVTVYGGQDIPGAETIYGTPVGSRGVLLKGSWRQRFVIHMHERFDADYFDIERGEALYGVGIRDAIFWMNWMRMEWLAKVSDFIDRVGLGITIFYYEEGNAPAQAEAEKAAKQQSGKVNITLPMAKGGRKITGVERVEVPLTGSEVLLKMVEALELKLERYIVGQEGSSRPNGEGLGNEAAAEFMQSTKQKRTSRDADRLEESLTGNADNPGLVWMLQRWTFPDTVPEQGGFRVRWKFDVNTTASEKKLNAAETAWEMGCTIKEAEVMEMAGLSTPTGQDKVLAAKPASAQSPPMEHADREDAVGFARNGQNGATHYAKDAGRWITIGGSKGGDGKRHGGSPVFVQGGRITKGAPSLTGKKIGAMKEAAEGGSVRAANKQQKGYDRARAAKGAKERGVEPKRLHQLAGEMLAHHRAFTADKREMLQDARKALAGISGHGQAIALIAGRGKDAGSVKGIDEVAEDMAKRFPSYFPNNEHASDVLFDMLKGGNPEEMSEEDAYEQALEHLIEQRHAPEETSSESATGWYDEEEFAPFVSRAEAVQYARLGHTLHAPAGGITIGGKAFEGGQFIPDEDAAKATPAEKKKLMKVKKDQPGQRGLFDPEPEKVEEPKPEDGLSDEEQKQLAEFKLRILREGGHSVKGTDREALDALEKKNKQAKANAAAKLADAAGVQKIDGGYRVTKTVDGVEYWFHAKNHNSTAPGSTGKKYSADGGKTWQSNPSAALQVSKKLPVETQRKAAPIAAHAAVLSAIGDGDLERVAGFPVRSLGNGQYRIEKEKGIGHVTGTAEEIGAYIDREAKHQQAHGKRLPEALERAATWDEPNFMDAKGMARADAAFRELPQGTPVVSLDDDAGTKGRTGRIVKDDMGRNRVKLDGEDGFASGFVEPLDKKLSWRVSDEEREKQEAEKPKQGDMFAAGEEAKQQNFTQFLIERGVSDPGLEHGTLGPSGKMSGRARDAFDARRRQEFEDYGNAQKEFQKLIDDGKVVDPLGRFTARPKEDLVKKEAGRRADKAAHLRGMARMASKSQAKKLEAEALALESETYTRVPTPSHYAAHAYSSTHFLLPKDTAARVLGMGVAIPDDDLAGKGRVPDPHLTVLYGLHADDPSKVAALVSGFGPVKVTLGNTAIFQSRHVGGNYDVLRIDVESPDLHRLHELLTKLPHAGLHANYVPHVTVCHTKPYRAVKYSRRPDFAGTVLTFDELVFSAKDGMAAVIPLLSGEAAQYAFDPDELRDEVGKWTASGGSEKHPLALNKEAYDYIKAAQHQVKRRNVEQLYIFKPDGTLITSGTGESNVKFVLGNDTAADGAIAVHGHPTPPPGVFPPGQLESFSPQDVLMAQRRGLAETHIVHPDGTHEILVLGKTTVSAERVKKALEEHYKDGTSDEIKGLARSLGWGYYVTKITDGRANNYARNGLTLEELIRYGQDAQGREHRGAGEGGGQFTGPGDNAPATNDERRQQARAASTAEAEALVQAARTRCEKYPLLHGTTAVLGGLYVTAAGNGNAGELRGILDPKRAFRAAKDAVARAMKAPTAQIAEATTELFGSKTGREVFRELKSNALKDMAFSLASDVETVVSDARPEKDSTRADMLDKLKDGLQELSNPERLTMAFDDYFGNEEDFVGNLADTLDYTDWPEPFTEGETPEQQDAVNARQVTAARKLYGVLRGAFGVGERATRYAAGLTFEELVRYGQLDAAGHQHAPPGDEHGGEFVEGGGSSQTARADNPGARTAAGHPIAGKPTEEQRSTAQRYVGASPGLSSESAAAYTDHLAHALSVLPAGIDKEAGNALKHGGVRFHPDLKALRGEAVKLAGKSAAGVVGFAQDKGMGTNLHLDGGDDPRGTYVHELWHAADNGGFHSDDRGWQAAYKKDILKGKHLLSRYALTNASEGFAEFGRALAERGLEHMTERYPNAVKHLKAKGLL